MCFWNISVICICILIFYVGCIYVMYVFMIYVLLHCTVQQCYFNYVFLCIDELQRSRYINKLKLVNN